MRDLVYYRYPKEKVQVLRNQFEVTMSKRRKVRRESGRRYYNNDSDEIVEEDYYWDDWDDWRDGMRFGWDHSFNEYTDKTRNKWSKQEQIKQRRRQSVRNKR